MLKNYEVLLHTLSQVSQEVADDIGRRASGLLSLLEKFDTYFGLKLSHLLFSATEQTSITLQNKDISIQEATSCSQCAINYLKRLRNDSSFDEFYTTAIKLADGHTG